MTFLYKPSTERILTELDSKRENYSDRTIHSDGMYSRVSDNLIRFQNSTSPRSYEFSDSALGQLLNRVKIPCQFYKRCPPNIQHQLFNHFNHEYGSDYFLRMNTPPSSASDHVRAVLSDKYGVIDDHHVFPQVMDRLRDLGNVTFRVFRYDDHITQLIVEFTDAQVEHNGITHIAGAQITNSETGHSSVWIEPVVHIPNCTYSSRHILSGQGCNMRMVHKGRVDHQRIAPMINQCKQIAQVGVVQLIESWTQTVTQDHAIRFARSIISLPKRMTDILEEEWKDEQRIVKAEAARRIILLAQELPLFQRVQIEHQTGKLIGLFQGYRSRMSDIMNEINS